MPIIVLWQLNYGYNLTNYVAPPVNSVSSETSVGLFFGMETNGGFMVSDSPA
jgi:hypothetical protein